MRRMLGLSLALGVALLLAVPSGAASQPTHLWVTAGAPVKLAGDVAFEAPRALLTSAGPGLADVRLAVDDATLLRVTIVTHLLPAPLGDPVPVEQRRHEEVVHLGPGPVELGAGQGAAQWAAAVKDLRWDSLAAAEVAPRDVWTSANAQLGVALGDHVLRPAAPHMPADLDAAQVDGFLTPAGTPLLRAATAQAAASLDRLLVVQGSLTTPHGDFATSHTVETRPGGVWLGDGRWTGPGHHVEDRVTYLLLTGHAKVMVDADAAPIQVAADRFRLQIDGMVQFPWAEGVLERDGRSQHLRGDQLLLGGRLTWIPVGTDVAGAPQIRLAGHGAVDYVRIGGLPVPWTAQETALVAGGTVVATGAVAAAVWYWPALKFAASGFFAGLYARLPKERVLEHKAREQVYQIIHEEPGISTNQLAERVDFGWSTLTYHLRVLERNEQVVSVRDGRHKRFFDRRSGRFSNGRKHLVSILKNASTRDIARFILEKPGVTQKEVGQAFGLAPSSVHWHVTRLTEAELVTKARDRHRVRYFPGGNWDEIDANDVGLEAQLVASAASKAPVNA